MLNIPLRVWNWFRRFRNRCGYGVHSPSDFYLITFVIYESLPYYAYAGLRELRKNLKHLPHYREKVDKLLFRLVNYYRPDLLLELGTGSGLSTCYLAAGNTQMKVLTSSSTYVEEVQRLLSYNTRIHYSAEGLDEMIRVWQATGTSAVMVHIAHTPEYKDIFERLLPLVGPQTCFLVGSPYADEEKKKWWKEIIADERTGVTFDLYDVGIVLFNKHRIKENRVVNFF